MARSPLPNALERRHWVERELGAEQALRVAEAYLEEGRIWEAIDFLAQAQARDRLRALRDEAVSRGDAFLLRELCRALGEKPSREHWEALARAADAAGKERYAAEARRQAQSVEG